MIFVDNKVEQVDVACLSSVILDNLLSSLTESSSAFLGVTYLGSVIRHYFYIRCPSHEV